MFKSLYSTKSLHYLRVVIICCMASVQVLFAQKKPNELTKYSHTQFLEKLTSTTDSVFTLKNAFIYFDAQKDSAFFYRDVDDYFEFATKDTVTIDVRIDLENVHFEHRVEEFGVALHHMRFTKPVYVLNTASLVFSNCIFQEGLTIDVDTPMNPYIDYFELDAELYGNDIGINASQLKGATLIDIGTIETFSAIFISILNTEITKEKDKEVTFYANNIRSFDFFNNIFKGEGFATMFIDKSRGLK